MPSRDQGHARSGRRNPDVAARIAANAPLVPDVEPDPGDEAPEENAMLTSPVTIDDTPTRDVDWDEPLWPGDQMTAKAGRTFTVDGEQAWTTYEVVSEVRQGESELDAFERINGVVNTRVMDMSADLGQRVTETNEQRARALRSGRITPTQD